MSSALQEDRPITIKDDKGNTSKLIAEIVALFITAMDKLKLDIRSMDDLHAELKVNRRPFQQQLITSQDLAEALSRLSLLPVDWQGRAKLVSWLDALSTMQVLLFIRLVSCLVVADSFDLCRPATSWTSRKPDS